MLIILLTDALMLYVSMPTSMRCRYFAATRRDAAIDFQRDDIYDFRRAIFRRRRHFSYAFARCECARGDSARGVRGARVR